MIELKGSMVALVTPMLDDGSIDKESLYKLVEWHIENHTHALIIAGTTGESVTLETAEIFDLLKTVVKQVNHRIPIIAGSGSNSTKHSIELTKNAELAGVDACLVVTPYYNKPSQNGLYEHYRIIAESTKLPIILYNVPGRTACDLLPGTVAKLAELENIIGIKEATGKVERFLEIQKLCGKEFKIYSGDDATAFELMRLGAHGIISVTANIAPKKMSQMCEALFAGNIEKANQINSELNLLHTNLFLESNPVPTKWALAAMGKIQKGIRLPLLTLDKQYYDRVKEAMKLAGV